MVTSPARWSSLAIPEHFAFGRVSLSGIKQAIGTSFGNPRFQLKQMRELKQKNFP